MAPKRRSRRAARKGRKAARKGKKTTKRRSKRIYYSLIRVKILSFKI